MRRHLTTSPLHLALLLASGLASASPAHAGRVAAVLTPSLTGVRASSQLAQETGFSTDRAFGFGGGVLLESSILGPVGIGLGALYSARKFQIGTGSLRVERTVPTLIVPVEARFGIGELITLGGGVFGAVKVGDVTDTVVVGSGSLQSTSASDRKTIETGFTASADVTFPLAPGLGILVGARYLYSVANGTSSAVYDEKIDDLMAQIGVSFSL